MTDERRGLSKWLSNQLSVCGKVSLLFIVVGDTEKGGVGGVRGLSKSLSTSYTSSHKIKATHTHGIKY